MPSFPAVLGWSSGCFTALASDELLLFLYEPPLGADRDASTKQRLEFLRTLTWSAFGAHRRARAAFWRMVTQRRDGSATGFERAPLALREALLGAETPLSLFDATGRTLVKPPNATQIHVACGSASTDFIRRCVERLEARLPLASVTELDGLDHLAPLTAPHRIADWMLSVLRASPASTPSTPRTGAAG